MIEEIPYVPGPVILVDPPMPNKSLFRKASGILYWLCTGHSKNDIKEMYAANSENIQAILRPKNSRFVDGFMVVRVENDLKR